MEFACAFPVAFNERFGFLIKEQISVHEVVLMTSSLLIIPTPFAIRVRECAPFVSLAGEYVSHSVLDVDVQWIGVGTVGCDKRFIKTACIRTVYERCAFS